jgi:hypothetical protein
MWNALFEIFPFPYFISKFTYDSFERDDQMEKRNRILKYSKYLAILFIVGAFSAVAHEYGHFFAFKALGYNPKVSYSAGRVQHYDTKGNLDPDLTPTEKIISSAAGPAMTLLLAVLFTALYLKHRGSFLLFALAITNAVMRLNIFIDGFNSDEGNISEILLTLMGNQGAFLVPLVVWTICIGLSCHLVNKQEFFKRTCWLIPLFFIISGVSMISSFQTLGLLLG